MVPTSTASHMTYLECQYTLFYNIMWDHAQAFKLNNYHYIVQLTLDSAHTTHDVTAGRLFVVLSLHIFTVLFVYISSVYFVVNINIKH